MEMKITVTIPDSVQKSVKKSLEGFGKVSKEDIKEETKIILEEIVFKNWDKIDFGRLDM
jgi:ribosome maturation protein Sdo1